MQKIYTSVLARRALITEPFSTLPYEAGWAAEALVFVQAEGPHPILEVGVDVSPDGIHWIPRPAVATLNSGQSLTELPVSQFGNWLRVRISGATAATPATVLVHLALKG